MSGLSEHCRAFGVEVVLRHAGDVSLELIMGTRRTPQLAAIRAAIAGELRANAWSYTMIGALFHRDGRHVISWCRRAIAAEREARCAGLGLQPWKRTRETDRAKGSNRRKKACT